MLNKNYPYKPQRSFYDFTNMTDAQIEREIEVQRAEFGRIISNVVKFPTKGE